MSAVKIDVIDINGRRYDLYADGRGAFTIKDGPTTLGHGETLNQARAKARTEIDKRQAKISVKFRTVIGEHGSCHGVHGTTRELLVRVGGETDRYDTRQGRYVLKDTTPDAVIERLVEIQEQETALNRERKGVIERLVEIQEQETALNRERKGIHEAWGFDLTAAVRIAIAAAAGADS